MYAFLRLANSLERLIVARNMHNTEPCKDNFKTDSRTAGTCTPDLKDESSVKTEEMEMTDQTPKEMHVEKTGGESDGETVTLKQQYFAMFMYILALIANSASMASTQALGGAVPHLQLNMWRYLAQTVIVPPITLITRRCDFWIPRSRLLLVSAMIFVSNVKNIALYTAPIYLPVGVGLSLHLSMILAMTGVISIFIKQDRSFVLTLSSFIAIVGILLMTQPDFIFPEGLFPPPPVVNYTSECTLQTGITADSSKSWIGYIFIIIASVAQICHLYGFREMIKDVTMLTYAMWVGIVGSIVSVILMGVFEKPVIPTSGYCVMLLLIHCFGASHYSMSLPWIAKYLNPTVNTLARAGSIVLLLVLQYTLLHHIQPGKENWLETFGAVTIIVACSIGPVDHIVKDYLIPKIKKKTDYSTIED